MAVINTIYEAIVDRRVLTFTYKGKERIVEPYIVGYDKTKLVLSAVQLSGGSGVGFRSFDVDALSEVAKTERRFSGTHPDYNPRDPYFAHILRQV
jgi:predicted DNA-binding transcriptional regulator YafY